MPLYRCIRSFVCRPSVGFAAALFLPLLAILTLAGAPVAVAQDQGAGGMQSPPYDPAQVTVPTSPPMALLGQPTYQQSCAPCHGEQGMGDGPRASQLPVPPPAFADPASVWASSPAQLFHTTKFGRLENLMPPFQLREDGGLTDEQIWQVVAYAWSLHTTQAEVEDGKALYAASCAACHGAGGQGDGPEAEGELLTDFSDLQVVTFRSQTDWSGGWQAAHPEIGAEWTMDEQSDTLDYIRTFSYWPPWEAGYQAGSGTIAGQVVQGTASEPAPADLPIVLEAYVGFQPVAAFTSTVGSDGAFRFTDLATDPNINYLATVATDGISYSSDFLNLSPLTPTLQSDVVVYGTTDDAGAVRINRSHWIIDQQPGAILGGAIYIFGNAGDRTFVGNPVEGVDLPVTVAVPVPPGAVEVALDGGALGDRFFQVGDVIYDTLPLLPGEGTRQIVVRYALPFEGTSADLQQEFLYPVDQLNLLAAVLPGLQVEAPSLDDGGLQDMGGQEYLVFSKENFAPQTVDVAVTGLLAAGSPDPRAEAVPGAESAAATSTGAVTASQTAPPLADWAIWLMLALVAAALLGVLGYALQRGSLDANYSRSSLAELRESLLQRMAQLDDMHALGQIGQGDWMRQRSYLKAQLVDVMQRIEGNT